MRKLLFLSISVILTLGLFSVKPVHSIVEEPFVSWCEETGDCYAQIPVELGNGLKAYATVRIGLDLGAEKHVLMREQCLQAVSHLAAAYQNFQERRQRDSSTRPGDVLAAASSVIGRCKEEIANDQN